MDLGERTAASTINGCIASLTHRFPDGPTYFVIVDADAPTALIARFDSFQVMVYSRAIAVALTTFICGLLTSSEFYNYLRLGGEVADPGTATTHSRREAVQVVMGEAPNMPHERFPAFVELFHWSNFMLAAHEIGHLALGHLGSSGLDGQWMSEAGEHASNDQLESRTWEWEADGFAAAAVAVNAELVHKQHPETSLFARDAEACSRIALLAAYVMFTILDLVDDPDRPSVARTHPPPSVRIGLTATLMSIILIPLRGSPELIQQQALLTSRAVEVTLNQVGGGMFEREEALRLQDAVQNGFNEMAPLHRQYARTLDRTRLSGIPWAVVFTYVLPESWDDMVAEEAGMREQED